MGFLMRKGHHQGYFQHLGESGTTKLGCLGHTFIVVPVGRQSSIL